MAVEQMNQRDNTIPDTEQEHYRRLFDNAPIGIFHFDDSGQILRCNESFISILDLTRDEIHQTSLHAIFPSDEFGQSLHRALITGNTSFRGEYQHPNGTKKVPVTLHLKDLSPTVSGPREGLGVLIDSSETHRYEQTIRRQASYDSLTGLPNRSLLLEQLGQELSRAKRHRQNGAVLFIDLDNFKMFNDSLGHQAGDQLLSNVARRLVAVLRKEDIVARMGGDEFVVILPQLDDNLERAAQKAQDVTKKLTAAMTKPFIVEDRQLTLTSSIGISLFPDHENNAADLLKQADTAVHQAKTGGPNTVRFFQPSMQKAAEMRLQLSSDIRRAIENEELTLFFQPQVAENGDIVGAEGLLRWTHPEKGMVPPLDFITIAEETAVIVEIGDWVLRHACKTIKGWEEKGLLQDHQTIAINVSPKEFAIPGFVDRVIAIIEAAGIQPHHLGIEITETSLIASIRDTIAKIQQLRNYGIKISIDDFGTGYSSLSYLKSLPLHTLKIDRSFINDIGMVDNEILLVEIIITMARNLGLEVVAEGVETADQFHYLTARGCKVFQGYYFCRPTDSTAFSRILQQGRLQTVVAAV